MTISICSWMKALQNWDELHFNKILIFASHERPFKDHPIVVSDLPGIHAEPFHRLLLVNMVKTRTLPVDRTVWDWIEKNCQSTAFSACWVRFRSMQCKTIPNQLPDCA